VDGFTESVNTGLIDLFATNAGTRLYDHELGMAMNLGHGGDGKIEEVPRGTVITTIYTVY